MGSCKDCISKEVCFKQTMRKKLAPEGFELDCRHFKSKKCIEVVRCKDCKYYVVQGLECRYPRHNGIIGMNGFCSYGERKEE